MKAIKQKILVVLFAAGAFSLGTMGHAEGEDKGKHDKKRQQIDFSVFADEAGLSSAQRAHLMTVMETARETRKLMRDEGKAALKAARKEHKADIQAALAQELSSEQVEAFQAFMQENRSMKKMSKKHCKDKKEKTQEQS